MKTISKKEYYMLYFQTYSLNKESKNKLSIPEIRVLTELLTHNSGKSSLKMTSPYYGNGRKKVLENINMKTTTYSNMLAKLKNKGFLIKLQGEDYALNLELQKLATHVEGNRKLYISYVYEIND
jgi:DNA-binding MarR family transcriptional regulator